MRKLNALLTMESGIFIAIITLFIYIGFYWNKVEAYDERIKGLEGDYKVLSRDLVDTQKDIIRDLGDIKGDIKLLKRRAK